MDAAEPGDVHAIGWATVDLDRAAAELAPLLRVGAVFVDAEDCLLLGARCRIGPAALGPGTAPFIVLLEPSTEARLAATLARHGEGWCATWMLERGDADTTSTSRAGPFGPERLVLGDPASGPHRLLVERATIRP